MKPKFRTSRRLLCLWPACGWGYYEKNPTKKVAHAHWRQHVKAFRKVEIKLTVGMTIFYRRSLGDPDGCGPYTRVEQATVADITGRGMEQKILAEREGGERDWVMVYEPWDKDVRCRVALKEGNV